MADIGAMLREARMREHRDIAEFEERTKIRAKYLRALEDEEWGLLPGYTFAKAFLRTYADMLGLDGRMLVDEFKRQYKDPSEAELSPLPGREGRRGRERTADHGREGGRERGRRQAGPSGRVMAVAVLVVLIAAALFIVHELRKKSTPPGTATGVHSTTTTTSHTSRSHHRPTAPRRVAVSLVALTPVRVCLVGYRTALGGGRRRINNTLMAAGSRSPLLHADDHFLASFTGGEARMVIDGHSHTVTASPLATVAYEIFRDGRYSRLAAGLGPHCT
jgi:hypothetical protein